VLIFAQRRHKSHYNPHTVQDGSQFFKSGAGLFVEALEASLRTHAQACAALAQGTFRGPDLPDFAPLNLQGLCLAYLCGLPGGAAELRHAVTRSDLPGVGLWSTAICAWYVQNGWPRGALRNTHALQHPCHLM
jgi:hypothetical protein